MDAQVASYEPPSAEDAARVRVVFTPTHSSRYNWGSRNALPPELSKISRLLGKLAREHREFPGRAVYVDRLNNRIANEIGEERGAGDDYVRALKNFAVLVNAVLPDGTPVTLYDQAQMDRAVAFQDGGPSLTEPNFEQAEARVVEILTQTQDDESSPPSSDKPTLVIGGRAPVSRPRPTQARHAPDLDDVVLKLDEAKQNISLPDGVGTLEDVVVNPLNVLKAAFRECDADRLQAMLSRAALSGYLTPIGKGVYRITLTPEADSRRTGTRGGEPAGGMDQVLEEERAQHRIALRKAQAAFEEELARLERERSAKFEELQRQHERGVRGQCDEVRRTVEKGLNKRRQEIDAKRDERLAVLEKEFEERKAALMFEVAAELHKAEEELQADADAQIQRIEQEGDQTWGESFGIVKGLEEQEEAELRPHRLRLSELEERVALIEKLQAQRKKPIV